MRRRSTSAAAYAAQFAAPLAVVALACALGSPTAQAQQGTVYRCPGPPVLYTDQITAQEAKEKGCRTIEGAPITIVQATRPRPVAAAVSAASGVRSGEGRIDPAEQRARDSDARRILGEELRREEGRLAEMVREFNNGEPERRGDERNFARYQERVGQMRAAIQRKEADIAAIRRELTKLPS